MSDGTDASISVADRYRVIAEEHRYASDRRDRIVRGYCFVVAALAVAFTWLQTQSRPLGWIVTLVAVAVTLLMWMADTRNRAGIDATRGAGTAIEEDPAAGVPEEQRFFSRLGGKSWLTRHLLDHSRAIDCFALVALVALGAATLYLWRNDGVLPTQALPTVGAVTCDPHDSPQVRSVLFFGLAKPQGHVSESEWQAFLRDVVTPRFPQGLTVWRADGQWRAPDGKIVREASRVLELIHADTPEARRAISTVADHYRRAFDQQSVMRVRTLVCASL